MAQNYLLVTDSSIHEKVKLREKFHDLEEEKGLNSLQSIRRKNMTSITRKMRMQS